MYGCTHGMTDIWKEGKTKVPTSPLGGAGDSKQMNQNLLSLVLNMLIPVHHWLHLYQELVIMKTSKNVPDPRYDQSQTANQFNGQNGTRSQ